MAETMGWISLIPVVLAITLAMITKDTVMSLIVACLTGCFIAGKGIFGFTDLMQSALGNKDFIWAALCILPFGIIVAYFEKSGAIEGFTEYMNRKKLSRRGTQFSAWLLGLFCWSDSLSPLFVGTTMRQLTDNARISREKLAYISDSTGACVSILYPFTGWTSYLAGLAVGIGCITSVSDGMSLMIRSIPFNFYAILTVLIVGLVTMGVIKDFGPMKKAEERAKQTGKVLRDGAIPLVSKEITEMEKSDTIKTRVVLNFVLPTVLLLCLALGSFSVYGTVKIVETASFVVLFMSVSFLLQGMSLKELSDTFMEGIKGIFPALLILSFAYCLNALSAEMGTANFIINMTSGFLTPQLLPFIIFIVAALMSFATGTSWGTFAICMPLALSMAFNASNNEVTMLVVLCFAAIAGGGVFGDHCSPISDTTIMASLGAAADHVDHVKTQAPYALVSAAISAVLYLVLGFALV